MAWLAAVLAVLAPLPLRGIPVAPLSTAPLSGPDTLLRRRRARIGAVHPQSSLQLRDPQLQPSQPLPLPPPPPPPPRPGVRDPQRGKLGVLRLDHRTQPRSQLTLLPGRTGQIGLLGHKPQVCS